MIEPHERANGGFRRYNDDQLRRLEIIQSLKSLGFELDRIRELFTLKETVTTGAELASSMIDLLNAHQLEIDRLIEQYREMRHRNSRGIEILRGCLCCSIKVFERDCQNCETYRRHDEVPDLVQCAIYQ